MKRFTLSVVVMMAFIASVFCQTPNAISYQAVARDANGNLLTSQTVSFRLSILQGSPSGTNVYSEAHLLTTNQFGVVVIEIGRGTFISGDFLTIAWENSDYFLQTEIDPSGGSDFQLMGTTQFLSVPYSQYATRAGNGIPAGISGQTIRNNGIVWVADDHLYNDGIRVGIGTTSPSTTAALEVKSSTNGVLLPRITMGQRDAISSPAEGLLVFCTNCGTKGSLSIYSDGAWWTFSPCTISQPTTGTNLASPGQIIWNWNTVSGASGYKWNTTSLYETATDMGTSTSKTETGTNCNTGYSSYVWAYNACGVSSPTTLTETTPAAAPLAPTAGTHVSTKTSIVWNWNTVSGATGYKWNTTNGLATAIEMGPATTKNESGLSCGTGYTRYVWAYNGCGYSTPLIMTQSTIDCWICGDPLTKNHVTSGGVAPVDKSVTYGTVTNIPGETSKCWITRNLGASQQASSVNDATEASAGWYWQFNRKQGYKHDGATRTPNTTWITSISENLDWTIANDPCALELGTGWRLPTFIEWNNLDVAGTWNNWNGPWDADLKMHAAGYLDSSFGSINYRGSYGYYWSGTKESYSNGWYLYFNSGNCYMFSSSKTYGLPLRCLRD